MKISIIVPAFNEEKLLGETLEQIKSAVGALANIGWETELIVCNNNSTDHTADIARAAGANVVLEPVNQIARARNSGAATATGDWLVFVDADSHPSAGLLADMAKEIQSGNCIAGGATLCWDQKRFNTKLMMPILNIGFRWRRMLHGPFIFVETAAFRKLGGFNDEAFAGEDWELSKRLKNLAEETGKQLVILHRHPVMTSVRRIKNYSVLIAFSTLYHIIFDPHCFATSRKAARRLYDGRRW